MKKPKYTTIFSSIVKPTKFNLSNILEGAALDEIRSAIPNIDFEKHEDLLGVSFNAYVANLFNKNDDGIEGNIAVATCEDFIPKYINVNHKRINGAVGVILTAGFSEFGSDKILLGKDVNKKDPFNITLGGVIWRQINEKLANLIEESNDPESEYYQEISASFEVGFDEFVVALSKGGSRKVSDCEIVTDEAEIAKLVPYLRAHGGSGKLDSDTWVFRLARGKVLPLGIGLTETPAAEVKGVAIPIQDLDKKDNMDATEVTNDVLTINSNSNSDVIVPAYLEVAAETKLGDVLVEKIKDVVKSCMFKGGVVSDVKDNIVVSDSTNDAITKRIIENPILDKPLFASDSVVDEIKGKNVVFNPIASDYYKKISQNKSTNVKHNETIMKITSLAEITDESLKQLQAATIIEFINDEFAKYSAEYKTLKEKNETDIKASQATVTELTEAKAAIEKTLKDIEAKVQALESEKAEREKQEKFNVRMAAFDEKYDLDADANKALASQIRDLSDEQFEAYEKQMEVFLKDRSKSAKQEIVASVETPEVETPEAVIDDAVATASQKNAAVPNTAVPQPKTLKEKYANAFTIDGFDIK